MAGLLRSARPSLVVLLGLALVLGSNGFVGAIHSVHHLPVPVESHEYDAHGHGHDGGQRDAPAGAPGENCPVAAAALHLSATMVEAPVALETLSPVARLVTLGTPDGPRLSRREPAQGRAPPSLRSLPS